MLNIKDIKLFGQLRLQYLIFMYIYIWWPQISRICHRSISTTRELGIVIDAKEHYWCIFKQIFAVTAALSASSIQEFYKILVDR
jgi:hypothetical protein